MMKENYNKYSYSYTLNELDSWYDNDTDRTNYALVLLRMEKVGDIKSLIEIYNTVYRKIDKTYYYNNMKFIRELNTCMNDNIIRLLKSADNPSKEEILSSYANLRDGYNLLIHRKEIKGLANSSNNKDLDRDFDEIELAQEEYLNARVEYEYKDYSPNTNGYKRVMKTIKENMKVLKKYGYITNDNDVQTGLTQEVKAKIFAILVIIAIFLVLLIIFGWDGLLGLVMLLGIGYWFVALLKFRYS